MEIVPALQQLGFAEYEARAYVALVKRSPLNGYELAKASGIPRANVYGVLERLAARRAVVRLDEPGGTRYAPVPPAELMRRLGSEYQDVAADTSRALEALEASAEHQPVWNVRGYSALLDHARATLSAAQRSLLLAVWPHEATALRADVAAADERGLKITTLCLAQCERECGGCRGEIYRYRAMPDAAPRRLVVVADGAEVVAGDIGPGDDTHSVRTQQPLLVDICSSAVRSSIALASVVSDLGPRLDKTLSPRTRTVLDAAAPAGGGEDFIDRMRALRVS
ncbi:MAG: HTH-type transcriptional regulator, sugar sensing transcriptional regulator [Candidatus Eremiobacteraeota bacterium]|jgi:predicted transcriptional regulator|nr:HTH-type transcriptional regulator, sugar sensing transcriptional regulator [Candidatus Eremiobacteraeota bacterium]